MGQARLKAAYAQSSYGRLERTFVEVGVDTSRPGFQNSEAFRRVERTNDGLLAEFGRFVNLRPRAAGYDEMVRGRVPEVARIVAAALDRERCRGACHNVSTAVSAMLDRLGIWNYVLKGGMTVEPAAGTAFESRHFAALESPDRFGNLSGHAWVVVPPFRILDLTARRQHWIGEDAFIEDLLPSYVLEDDGQLVQPRLEDCIGDDALLYYMRHVGPPHPNAHHDMLPHLRAFGRDFPSLRIVHGNLAVRYLPVGVGADEGELETAGPFAPMSSRLKPIDVWVQEVEPRMRSGAT